MTSIGHASSVPLVRDRRIRRASLPFVRGWRRRLSLAALADEALELIAPCGDKTSIAGAQPGRVRWLDNGFTRRQTGEDFPRVTEQLAAKEPGIQVPQGNSPDRHRTNTKP